MGIQPFKSDGVLFFRQLIFPKQFMNQLGLAHNARWINWVSKAGVDIIDIGIFGNNSDNYLMEILFIGKWLF